VFIYYASSDTRLHVATTTVERLLDYVRNTAQDGFSSAGTVRTLMKLIDRNLSVTSISADTEGAMSKVRS
jgi:4-O-beta-D-mannosyl-D-glucose phosphorylase